jgi:sec-independent protein translocase protein TatB
MSGVGFWELILLFLIGLIVLGPERLPRVANQLGTWLGQARRMTRVLKRQLEDELNLEKDSGFRPHPVPQALPHKAVHKTVDKSLPEHDDTYSAAHGPDSPGTGVGNAPLPAPLPGESDDFSDTDVLDEAMVDRRVHRDDGDNGDDGEHGEHGDAGEDKTSGSVGKT